MIVYLIETARNRTWHRHEEKCLLSSEKKKKEKLPKLAWASITYRFNFIYNLRGLNKLIQKIEKLLLSVCLFCTQKAKYRCIDCVGIKKF